MDTRHYTLLIAEDQEASRFLYENELHDAGYQIRTAENGLQVLGMLEDFYIDLLITDVKMPDMSAQEMVPLVRQEYPDLPVLVISAYKEMENDLTLRAAKVSGYFNKPIDFPLLKAKIHEILSGKIPTDSHQRHSDG